MAHLYRWAFFLLKFDLTEIQHFALNYIQKTPKIIYYEFTRQGKDY